MPMPPATLTIATSDPVPLFPQEAMLRSPVTPLTPTTPRSSEAFVSLQNQIIKQYAHVLDEADKQRLHKLLGKFVNAGQMCLVKGSLQQDRIRFLMQINNEAKTRRSTKSDILAKGEGLVVSYEHLVAKRAARAASKDSKASGKGKRGRKRKSPEEVDSSVPSTKMSRARLGPLDDTHPVCTRRRKTRTANRVFRAVRRTIVSCTHAPNANSPQSETPALRPRPHTDASQARYH